MDLKSRFGTSPDNPDGSVAREVRALAKEKGFRVNAVKFAKAWRAGYRPAMDKVLRGEAPFQKIDAIHRAILEEVMLDVMYEIPSLTGVKECVVTREVVEHRARPELVLESKAAS